MHTPPFQVTGRCAPQAAPALPADTVCLWRIDLAQQPARQLLAAQDMPRLYKIGGTAAATRFRHLRTALRGLLARYTGLPAQQLDLATRAGGKPWLRNAPALHFNLSHTLDTALLAATRVAPVGVDIEFGGRRHADAMLKIARRVLGDPAATALAALAPDRRESAFLLDWTRLEARQKASGEGLFGARLPAADCFEAVFTLQPRGFAALALAGHVAPVRVQCMDLDNC